MVTIKDISKVCHVSVSTVSRALNNYSDINEETKQLILQKANELNYIPNKAARQLVKKITNRLAIITRTIDEENLFNVLRGLYKFCETIGYEVSLHSFSSSLKQNKSYYTYCKENNIEAVLLYGIHTNDPYIKELVDKKFPTVIIDCAISSERVTNITINNYKASYEAVAYLIKSGCKNIISIQGGHDSYVTRERVKGFKDALIDNSINFSEKNIYYGDFTEKTGETLMSLALKEHKKIDAVFCSSDNIAIGVYNVLNQNNLTIPKDISVIGFGDFKFCEFLSPKLSSVKQSMYDFGYEGGKELYNMIKNKTSSNIIQLNYEIKIRESVKNI